MKKLISFGNINFKFLKLILFFLLFCILIIIGDILGFKKIYHESNKKKLLNPLLYFFAFFSFLFIGLVSEKIFKKKADVQKKKIENNSKIIIYIFEEKSINDLKSFSLKDVIFLFIMSIFLLILEIMDAILEENSQNIYDERNYYLEFLILFLLSKYILHINFYSHHNISIISIISFGLIRYFFKIFIIIKHFDKILFLINFIYIILEYIKFAYIKGLIDYKYFSIYKACYVFGIINLPIIIILYFIVSYIPCETNYLCTLEFKDKKYFDNIYGIFKDLSVREFFMILIYNFYFAILEFWINIIIINFSFFHIFIVLLICDLIISINTLIDNYKTIYLICIIICFSFELFMCFVFLEIIILNFFGLDKNTHKNIEERAVKDINSTLYLNIFDDSSELDEENRNSGTSNIELQT